MRMLTKEDVKALTADQKLELMDLLSESLEEDYIPMSPEVRDEVEGCAAGKHEEVLLRKVKEERVVFIACLQQRRNLDLIKGCAA